MTSENCQTPDTYTLSDSQFWLFEKYKLTRYVTDIHNGSLKLSKERRRFANFQKYAKHSQEITCCRIGEITFYVNEVSLKTITLERL